MRSRFGDTKLPEMSHMGNVACQQLVNVTVTILFALQNQHWGPFQCGVDEVMVKGKFRGFVSSELVGVPNYVM